MAKKTTQVHTLADLLVEEVSVVDRPANKRRFLAIKSEDGKGAEIQTGPNGELVTETGGPDGTPTDAPPIAEVFKAAGEAFADLEKRLTIDPDLRREIFSNLGEAMGRLNTVMIASDVAQSDRDGTKGTSTLVPVLAAELDAVAKVLAGISRKIGKTKAQKDEGEEDAAQKALLGLVEAVEVQVEKAGAKMSKARLAAFKAAMDTLAKILQELDPPAAAPDLDKAAKKPTEKAAHVHTFKANGQTVTTGPSNAMEGAAHTHPVTIAFEKLTTTSDPGGGGHTHKVTSKGKALTSSGPTAPKEKPAGNPFAKSEDGPAPELVALTKMVADLTTTVKKQAKDLRGLRQARPGSNSIPVEKTVGDGPPPSVSWPLDMNDEKTPERVDKATSFLDS